MRRVAPLVHSRSAPLFSPPLGFSCFISPPMSMFKGSSLKKIKPEPTPAAQLPGYCRHLDLAAGSGWGQISFFKYKGILRTCS